jgi:sugar phosphate isomerase/epimerase
VLWIFVLMRFLYANRYPLRSKTLQCDEAPMPSFSLAALTALDLAPPQLIAVAAACGYQQVGLRLLPAMPGGIAYRLMDDAAGLKETIARLDATGITVADLEVVAFGPETEVAAFSAFFEAGARLGAKHILVAAYDPELSRFADRFARFCEAAAPYGLTGDLEFMPWTAVPDLKTASRVIGQVGQPNAGVLVDALHFDRSQSAVGDIASIPQGRLHYWQLCDAPAERPVSTEEMIHAARNERIFPRRPAVSIEIRQLIARAPSTGPGTFFAAVARPKAGFRG